MKKILIKNGRVIDPETGLDQITDILVEEGKIATMGKIEADNVEVMDAEGLLVMPGAVDLHVHLRDLEQKEKETIETGTQAALAGGVTTVFSMPNTKPALSSVETIKLYQERLRNAAVHVHVIGAITKGLDGHTLSDIENYPLLSIRFISDDGQDVNDEATLEEAYKLAEQYNLTLITHPEMETIGKGGVLNEGKVSRQLALPGQPNAKEYEAVKRGIRLALKTGARAHFTHLSTKESVELIREAKKHSELITCDCTPHHFSLTEEEILRSGTLAKVNPPLRTEEDRQAVVEGLRDGTIDCIATDHAPHVEADKPATADRSEDFLKAAFGISQLETSIASTFTELYFKQGMPLIDVVRLLTLAPAKLAGLPVGRIHEGAPADLVLVDLNLEKTVDRMNFISKGKNTPFHGKLLRGWPVKTMIRGQF